MKAIFLVLFTVGLCLVSFAARVAPPSEPILSPPKILSPPNNFQTNANSVQLSGTVGGSKTNRIVYVLPNGNYANLTNITVASGATNWSTSLNLIPGTNTVWVWVVDAAGKQSPASQRSFFYVVPYTLTIQTNGGSGMFKGLTNGATLHPGAIYTIYLGRSYEITATSNGGQFFANWDNTNSFSWFITNATVATLDFIVQTNLNPPYGCKVLNTNNVTLGIILQTNLTLTARFVPNVLNSFKGTYNGLFTNTTGVGSSGGIGCGYITITMTSGGVYSGKLLCYGHGTTNFTGEFSYDNINSNAWSYKNIASGLDLYLTNSLSAQLNGFVHYSYFSEDWNANISGKMATNQLILAKSIRYNFYISNLTNAGAAPPAEFGYGYGYGSVLVSSGGNIALTLSLADSVSAVSFPSKVAIDQSFPFYAPLYSGKGLILGWMYFTNSAMGNLFGTNITWIKNSNTKSKFYPFGFTNNLSIIGSRYIAPPTGTNILTWTSGALDFSGGNLILNYAAYLTYVVKSNTFSFLNSNPYKAKLTLTKSTGLISGSFADVEVTGEPTRTFHGVVLPKSDLAPFPLGVGFFLGINQSGPILLLPR